MGQWTGTQTTKEPITAGLERFNQMSQSTIQNLMNTLLTVHQLKQNEQQSKMAQLSHASKLFEEFGGEGSYSNLQNMAKAAGILLPDVKELKSQNEKVLNAPTESVAPLTADESILGPKPRKFSEHLKEAAQSFGTDFLTPKQWADARKEAHKNYTEENKSYEKGKIEYNKEKAAEARLETKGIQAEERMVERLRIQDENKVKEMKLQHEFEFKKLKETLANHIKEISAKEGAAEGRRARTEAEKELKELEKNQTKARNDYKKDAVKLYNSYLKGDFTSDEAYYSARQNLYEQYGQIYEDVGLPTGESAKKSTLMPVPKTGMVQPSSGTPGSFNTQLYQELSGGSSGIRTEEPAQSTSNPIDSLKDYARKGDKKAQAYLKSQGIKWQQ
jgi:hypothetical protein